MMHPGGQVASDDTLEAFDKSAAETGLKTRPRQILEH